MKKIHMGRNVKRFREMLSIKQEAFAAELGDDWNQKKVSLLEQKETIEDDLLQQVAKVLKVPVEAIKNFDEEKAVILFQVLFMIHMRCRYLIPLLSLHYIIHLKNGLETLEENKKLYERLLLS